jgi:hypothetical protein
MGDEVQMIALATMSIKDLLFFIKPITTVFRETSAEARLPARRKHTPYALQTR